MVLREIEQVTQDEDHEFYALSQDINWQLTNSGEYCPCITSGHTMLTL
jgi:hypothetical protein